MSENYIDKWNANGQQYDIQDAGRGLPLGVATLDNNGRIPYSQLPESAVEFKGYWNASTNTPHLVDGTGDKGDMYYVDVAGQQNLGSGVQYFNVGDRILYDGAIWKNISQTSVKSVNGVLPNAQGNVNILNKVYPVGSIYQNMTDPTNPAVLFGIGTWVEVNDRFLISASHSSFTDGTNVPKYSEATTGGATSVTLTEANIPRHSHRMVHYHTYDIQHGHTATDAGHVHNYKVVTSGQNGVSGNDFPASYGWANAGVLSSEVGHAQISVSAVTPETGSIKLSSEPQNQQSQGIEYTDPWGGDSTHSYATASFNIIPSYQAVYTWYRTA